MSEVNIFKSLSNELILYSFKSSHRKEAIKRVSGKIYYFLYYNDTLTRLTRLKCGLMGSRTVQDDLPAIITKWMDNGTALEYLKNQHPEVDTLSMVSLREVNTILL